MKIKFLFWNINNEDLTDLVVELVKQELVDVVLLAESKSIKPVSLERKLTKACGKSFKSRYNSGQKVMLLDTLGKAVKRSNEDKRTSDCQYTINGKEILLVGVHLRDKFSVDSEDLYDLAGQHREFIDKYQVENVIVVGDFNMNPYEKGIMGYTGFNAIMSKQEIKYNSKRKFGYSEKEFYYNPSWDAYNLSVPNGTYYYSSNTTGLNPYWNLLDQVLISSSLMNNYVKKSFKIVTKVGSTKLLTTMQSKSTKREKKIVDKTYSDHLPITFEIYF